MSGSRIQKDREIGVAREVLILTACGFIDNKKTEYQLREAVSEYRKAVRSAEEGTNVQ